MVEEGIKKVGLPGFLKSEQLKNFFKKCNKF